MPASILASFISFIVTGIYAWYLSDLQLANIVKISLLVSIFANAAYFFYFEALIEIDSNLQKKLKKINTSEWYLRVLNQTLLFSLWFLIELNIIFFFVGLVVLYILFVVWDFKTKECFENRVLFYLDISGLIISFIFVISVYYLQSELNVSAPEHIIENAKVLKKIVHENNSNNINFLMGGIAVLYFLIPVIGVSIVESDLLFKIGLSSTKSKKLFSKEVWSRDGLT
jgi:hypothetical protein